MLLGAAPLLAPLPEAFLAFMLPAGLASTVRLLAQGDEAHLAMGLLAACFVPHCGHHVANPLHHRVLLEIEI